MFDVNIASCRKLEILQIKQYVMNISKEATT